MNILVINGPNLNLLGEREPELYGRVTLAEIIAMLEEEASKWGVHLRSFQSNHEGAIIDKLHTERSWMDALIMNPAALTHYSFALRDAVSAIQKPMIEVHLSDLSKREEFRHFSVFDGLDNVRRIMGRGAQGYVNALRVLVGTGMDYSE